MRNEIYSTKLEVAAVQNQKENEYWLKKLGGNLVRSHFHYDYKNKRRFREYEFDAVEFTFARKLFERLMKLSNGIDYTLNIVLVSGLILLVNKYTGINDIVLGTSVHKQETDLDFINTVLPLRNQIRENMTFKELLLEVRDTIRESVENQNYPIEILLKELYNTFSKEDDFPLFDIAIILENIHDKNYLKNINYNILFSFERTDDCLKGTIEYNVLLYKKTTIERIIEHFRNLLNEIVFHLDTPVSNASMISAEEKAQLLFDFNNTDTEYPGNKTIPELFEEIVEKTPDSIAIKFKDEQITFKELNKKANQLGRVLLGRGVKPGSIVGIMMDRSVGMILGILSILKVGGAYLPIEIDNPPSRILSMLEDCRVSVLLTENCIQETQSYTYLQNLHSINEEFYQTCPRERIRNFDDLPILDRSLIDNEKYFKCIGQGMVKNSITIQATRGCPFNCIYCCRVWTKYFAGRSAENIFSEIQLYYNLGIRRFVFIDDIFNLNSRNSIRLFELLIENNLKIQMLFPSGLQGNILTKEYIDLMIKAGTISITIALETASPRLQKLIKKNIDLDKLRENINYTLENYPQVILELHTMLGFPTETEEEAMMTLDFIKSFEWIHFPYIHILKIYSGTDMEKLALKNGISKEAIYKSENLAYHELPDTLPFDKNFVLKYQADFLNNYFLAKKRLLSVLPHQMAVLSEDEIVQKYDSYLPVEINSLADLLEFCKIEESELKTKSCLNEDDISISNFNSNIKKYFPRKEPGKNALKVLLLDLSQLFSEEGNTLYDIVEQPLGLMYLMTYLNHKFPGRINGKIAKSRINFNDFSQLKSLLKKFEPDIIGIRTLTIYRDFFHKSIALIRQWGIEVPIVAGGPYSTIDYRTILMDRNVDLAVIGEGEITFGEIIQKFMENNGQLPDEEVLKEITGIAFNPFRKSNSSELARDIIMIDELPFILANESGDNLKNIGHSSNLAYAMYTSGSTGKPKAVLPSHRNVIRLIRDTNYIGLKEDDRILQLSNYAFDGSVFDIYGALLNGSTLVMIDKFDVLSVDRLSGLIAREKISVFFVTTALFNALVDMNINCFSNIRKILFGGERISVEHARRAFDFLGKGKLIHVYGPTETTVYATYYFINEVDDNLVTIPIGEPISNTKIYILVPSKKIAPIGVNGEIYISGDGVAPGYLNNNDLTSEKFVPNPFEEGGRLYSTGDLARWLPDGNVEFSGRIDNLVKIRGFRIEPGEIESRLLMHPEVKEAVVIDREDEEREKYLSAYIVLRKKLDIADIKDYLSRVLPDYMIPSYFIPMEKIPLNANKKVNRNALPEPGENILTGVEYVAPQNELQKKIVSIWKEVLKLDKVGINDNIFDLGGTSIDILRLNRRFIEVFKRDIPIVVMFRYTTIHSFEKYLNNDEAEFRQRDSALDRGKIDRRQRFQKRMEMRNG